MKFYNRNDADALLERLGEELGYDLVLEHLSMWLNTDTLMHALLDLATDYDIDIEED